MLSPLGAWSVRTHSSFNPAREDIDRSIRLISFRVLHNSRLDIYPLHW
jgi:hypothetical protein